MLRRLRTGMACAPRAGQRGEGVDEGLLGTAERTDGACKPPTTTYRSTTSLGDQAAGDVNGQGLFDAWSIVDASGAPVEEQARDSRSRPRFGDVLVTARAGACTCSCPTGRRTGRRPATTIVRRHGRRSRKPSPEFLPGEGVDGSLFGTVARDNGTQQVTYSDLPLYLFSGDEVEGE